MNKVDKIMIMVVVICVIILGYLCGVQWDNYIQIQKNFDEIDLILERMKEILER